jgi:hypothetical protein
MKITLPKGESISLPADLADSWTYLLFYRGGW